METLTVNGERIHIKHSKMFGWRVVHPIKDENGKVNTVNLLFGGKGNLITLIFIMIVMASILVGVNMMMEDCNNFTQHPEDYIECCSDCGEVNAVNNLFVVGNLTPNG